MGALQDYFAGQLHHKLFVLAVFAVIGILVTILRKVGETSNSVSRKNLIDKFKQGKLSAIDFISGIDIPYGKIENVDSEDFRLLAKQLNHTADSYPWTIDYAELVTRDKLLIMASIRFESFGTGVTGGADVIQSKNNHNFLVSQHLQKKELVVFSDLHSTSDEKFQKDDFIRELGAIVKGH